MVGLSKRFKQSEVESYINKIDEYEIDFDKTLDEIKDDINNLCKKDPGISTIDYPLKNPRGYATFRHKVNTIFIFIKKFINLLSKM